MPTIEWNYTKLPRICRGGEINWEVGNTSKIDETIHGHFQLCHQARAAVHFPGPFQSFFYFECSAITMLHGNKLDGTSTQSKSNTRNAAGMRYWRLETCRFELQPPTALEGAIAAGVSPPIVLELELYHNSTSLAPNP